MMSQRVTLDGKVKGEPSEAEAKASVNSAFESSGVDTKPSDLSMARLKHG
jgi:hypothetical protein